MSLLRKNSKVVCINSLAHFQLNKIYQIDNFKYTDYGDVLAIIDGRRFCLTGKGGYILFENHFRSLKLFREEKLNKLDEFKRK